MSHCINPTIELRNAVRVFGFSEQHGPAVDQLFDKVGVLQLRLLRYGIHTSNVTQD